MNQELSIGIVIALAVIGFIIFTKVTKAVIKIIFLIAAIAILLIVFQDKLPL